MDEKAMNVVNMAVKNVREVRRKSTDPRGNKPKMNKGKINHSEVWHGHI